MTDDPGHAKADALQTVREITRRAGHEIRNALSGVAVNVEVVRSRVSRGNAADDIATFADRAALQISVATALTNGLLALVNSALAAQAQGTLRSLAGSGAGSRVELMIYGDQASVVVSDIKRFADLIGVGIEEHSNRVILTVSPEGRTNPKI